MEKKHLGDPIGLGLAVGYASNWRAYNKATMIGDTEIPLEQILCNGFTFHTQDIIDLANETGVSTIRVYFGFDGEAPKPNPDPAVPGPMKIMLVGVNDDQQDIIYAHGDPITGVYDFATPCPPTCDTASPMVTGIMPSQPQK